MATFIVSRHVLHDNLYDSVRDGEDPTMDS